MYMYMYMYNVYVYVCVYEYVRLMDVLSVDAEGLVATPHEAVREEGTAEDKLRLQPL